MNRLKHCLMIMKNPYSFDYPVLRSSEVCGPLIISIGNNGVRRKIAEKLQVEYGRGFHPSAIISEKAVIKEGTVVMQGLSFSQIVVLGVIVSLIQVLR